jgi:hypothetical protein
VHKGNEVFSGDEADFGIFEGGGGFGVFGIPDQIDIADEIAFHDDIDDILFAVFIGFEEFYFSGIDDYFTKNFCVITDSPEDILRK